MVKTPWTFWDFDWTGGRELTDQEFKQPMRGLWHPSLTIHYDGLYRGRTNHPQRDYAMFHRLTWGKPIDHWDESTNAESGHPLPLEEYPQEIEDVPYSIEAPIVSERTRDLVETVAPGCVQFLPVTMTQFGGKPIRIGRYWVMNIVKLVDCLDPEPGTTAPLPERIAKYMPPDNVQLVYERTRFVSEAVPPDAALFRMRTEYITIVARRDVCEAFKSYGITGVRFMPLWFKAASP